MSKREEAERYFVEGYSCAQAVVLAFEEYFDVKRDVLLKIASSFGGGMGRLREVCGGVSGMIMAAGAIYAPSDPFDKQKKAEHYARVQKLAREFKEKNGSIVCRDLIGAKLATTSCVPDERTPEYYKTRPCARLVGDAAEILENFIAQNPFER